MTRYLKDALTMLTRHRPEHIDLETWITDPEALGDIEDDDPYRLTLAHAHGYLAGAADMAGCGVVQLLARHGLSATTQRDT